MITISHRGFWKTPEEKNQEVAFHRSFDEGFGTETDIRDLAGKLVISHDIPTGGELRLEHLLTILGDRNLPLAINIKADGLVKPLVEAMKPVKDWFVFDMSVPDMRGYLAAGVPVFTRMSEVERQPVWLEQSAGVWLDGFEGIWYDNALIESLIQQGKRVCVVSNELHKKEHLPLWKQLLPLAHHDLLLLCTDLPTEAEDFFKG